MASCVCVPQAPPALNSHPSYYTEVFQLWNDLTKSSENLNSWKISRLGNMQ